jgi:hypothetical protein
MPLTAIFEYVYSTKELDYAKYLGYAGLKIDKQNVETKEKGIIQKLMITRVDSPTPSQTAILKAWLGE